MAELEQLEQEELDNKMLSVGPTPSAKLPEVPADSLGPQKQKATKGMWETFNEILLLSTAILSV